MDLNFLVQITKDEERTLMKAFAILAPLLYSSFWLYVPLFKTADIILRCALLASAIIAILYFERGFMGLISMSKGLELKIPLSVYVGFPIAATVILLLTPWDFGSGIKLPLVCYSAAIVLNALFFRKAVRLASIVLTDEPKAERIKPKTKHGK